MNIFNTCFLNVSFQKTAGGNYLIASINFMHLLVGPSLALRAQLLWANAIKALILRFGLNGVSMFFHEKSNDWLDRWSSAACLLLLGVRNPSFLKIILFNIFVLIGKLSFSLWRRPYEFISYGGKKLNSDK